MTRRIKTHIKIRDLSVRLYPDLHEKLKESAKKNKTSLNQEMLRRLNESFYIPSLGDLLERVRSFHD